MNRNLSTEAIVLKANRFGEMNKTVTLFSPDFGILRAAAYGAYKGKNKLSGSTEPFVQGTAYLYAEPAKKRYKITALEPTETHESIPGDLDRYFVATFWAEILIQGYGGGEDARDLFALLSQALFALHGDNPALVNIQFLWRYLALEGYGVDLEHCARCDLPFPDGQACFIASDGDLVCGRCAPDGAPSLPAGVRRYLRHTESLSLLKAVKVGMGSELSRSTKTFLTRRIQGIMEYPLKTLDAGLV